MFEGVESWQCTGTPVDCVKLAVDKVLHHKPDICLSGINHGANHSINVIYSGTMSAAVEAAIESIPSIGFSLLDYSLFASEPDTVARPLAYPTGNFFLCIPRMSFPPIPPAACTRNGETQRSIPAHILILT